VQSPRATENEATSGELFISIPLCSGSTRLGRVFALNGKGDIEEDQVSLEGKCTVSP
jgi:hypothetical protein